MRETKQSFWKGSAILLLSAIVTKGLGACFKIPLTNVLGGTGMGYFSSAYGLLLPIYALSVTGLSASVSQTVARSAALENWLEVRRIRRIARIACGCLGILLSLFIFLLAEPFSVYMAAQTDALFSVIAIAPAAFFGCLTSVERGYWEGLENMTPTAISQAIEALAKLGFGLVLCQWVLAHPSVVCDWVTPDVPLSALAAAAAVWGVTLSTFVGWLYFLVRSAWTRNQHGRINQDMPSAPTKIILRRLLYVMIPVALGSLVTNLTSLLDLVTMMRCLGKAQLLYPDELVSRFGEIAEETEFPAFVYGSFTGMAITVFNLVPSVTNMLGKSALPRAASLWAKQDQAGVVEQVRTVSTAVSVMALPAAGMLYVLAEPVMRLLYSGRQTEAFLAAQALRALLPGMVFLCLTFPLCSMLQGIGKAAIPVECMLVGVAVKLVGNLILIPQPAFCITGAGIATSFCYLTLLILVLVELRRILGQPLRVWRMLWKPVIAATACTLMTWKIAEEMAAWNLWIMTGCACIVGGIVYVGLLWGLSAIKR